MDGLKRRQAAVEGEELGNKLLGSHLVEEAPSEKRAASVVCDAVTRAMRATAMVCCDVMGARGDVRFRSILKSSAKRCAEGRVEAIAQSG